MRPNGSKKDTRVFTKKENTLTRTMTSIKNNPNKTESQNSAADGCQLKNVTVDKITSLPNDSKSFSNRTLFLK